MRILQLVTRNELRGAEVFAGQLSDALVGRGHSVVLAALYRRLDPKTATLELQRTRAVELDSCEKGRIELRTLLRLHRLVREFRPDLVQANGFHSLKYASILKRLTRVRWPIVYRNISIASVWIRRGVQTHWGHWLARSIAYVASVSDASAADFADTYGVEGARTITIHRGIEIPHQLDPPRMRSRIRELIAVKSHAPLLVHIGGYTEEKNHSGLLDAFQVVHESHPTARLVLFGDGPLRTDFERRVQAVGLVSNVHCLGNRTDARDLLAGADILLLPSHIEGIPGVVLEAAARKIPSVCTDVGAVHEAVQNGVSGILVQPDDMAEMARATCELLNDNDRRRSLGEAAYRHVQSHHDMQRTVTRFEELYRTAIDEEGTAGMKNPSQGGE